MRTPPKTYYAVWMRQTARALSWLGMGLVWVLTLVVALGMNRAHAQAVADESQLPALARQWLDQNLARQTALADTPLRLQAQIGALDSRLKLAPCAQTEVYVPAGSRLWGPSRLGLRCLVGATRWNVSLPVSVQALGPAWVLRRDVTMGATLSEADFALQEVDWAAAASPILSGAQAWDGLVAMRQLHAGQILRQNMVRAVQVLQAGSQVRVLVQGGGFQISAQGEALMAGVVGQNIRVKIESGRVLTAKVLDGRTVQAEI